MTTETGQPYGQVHQPDAKTPPRKALKTPTSKNHYNNDDDVYNRYNHDDDTILHNNQIINHHDHFDIHDDKPFQISREVHKK
eukprot:6415110-Heterocapsa_arctica.AAC.1